MGAFTQRPSTYTPPLDGGQPMPTLVGSGGSADPEANAEEWRIELRRHPILHRGHASLVLVGPNGPAGELDGWARSRLSGREMAAGLDGNQLFVARDKALGQRGEWVANLASGSRDEIGKLWARAEQAADAITAKNFDYKGHDPSFEIGGGGGQIQNSNSVAYSLSRAMGLDADAALRQRGMEQVFPGWGRDLLDPRYKPYVAPPQFAVSDTP